MHTSNHWEKQNDAVERKKDSSTGRWKTLGSIQLSPPSHLFLEPLCTEVSEWFLVFLTVAHFLCAHILVHPVVPPFSTSHLLN